MIGRASRGGWVFLSAAAVAGVVLAHAIAYAVVLPDTQARSEYLQASGHGYWGVAVYLAAALGAVAVAWAALRGAAGSAADLPQGAGFGPLAAGQVVCFALVEAIERAVVGAPVSGLWREPTFVVGLVVQVAVAAVLAVLLRQAETLAARVAAALRPRRPAARRRQQWWVPAGARSPGRRPGSPARSRAPPTVAVAP